MQCTNLVGAIKLLMFLPGETVKCCRTKIAETMTRHLKGDPTLAAETTRNKAIGMAAACSEMLKEAATDATGLQLIDEGGDRGITGAKRFFSDISAMDVQKITAVYEMQHRKEAGERETLRVDLEVAKEKAKLEVEMLEQRALHGETVAAKAKLEMEISAAKAKWEAEADARLESAKDADLRRLEQRFMIESRFNAVATPVPLPTTNVTLPSSKTVYEIASGEAYWGSLSEKEKIVLVTKAGKVAVQAPHGIPAELEKKGESAPNGAWNRVNAFGAQQHAAIRGVLEDVLKEVRAKRSQQRTLNVFWNPS